MSLRQLLFPTCSHEDLGPLTFRWNRWEGREARLLGFEGVEVRLPGTRRGPSPEALAKVTDLPKLFSTFKAKLEDFLSLNLFVSADSTQDNQPLPESPSDAIWQHTRLAHVWIGAYGSESDIELGFDHTNAATRRVGAIFRDGALYALSSNIPLELSGGADARNLHYAGGTAVRGSGL